MRWKVCPGQFEMSLYTPGADSVQMTIRGRRTRPGLLGPHQPMAMRFVGAGRVRASLLVMTFTLPALVHPMKGSLKVSPNLGQANGTNKDQFVSLLKPVELIPIKGL